MSLPIELPACPPGSLPPGSAAGGLAMTAPPLVSAPACTRAQGPAAPGRAAGLAARLATLRQPVDFQRVLGSAPSARSPHFSVHHALGRPALPARALKVRSSTELSTGDAPTCPLLVDDRPAEGLPGRWLGLVVPKRHAKRAVTRTLIKRQMRCVMHQAGPQLLPGLWVLRLRAPFDKSQFISAASAPLRAAVRQELAALVAKALLHRPPQARPHPASPAARGPAHA